MRFFFFSFHHLLHHSIEANTGKIIKKRHLLAPKTLGQWRHLKNLLYRQKPGRRYFLTARLSVLYMCISVSDMDPTFIKDSQS